MEYKILGYPRLNIIYDNRRTEKYEPLIKELDKQGIVDYKIWPCIVKNDVVESINASHKMIVQKAKDDGEQMVAIAEDDLMFTGGNSWEWFLQNIPPVFDIYVAANYLPMKKEGSGAFRIDNCVGFHLYIVHSRYYDTFLATPDKGHIDTEQKSKLMYCCYPFAALQRSGWSANNKAIVDYNKGCGITEKDLYK